jgi:hypothetical protein
MDQPHKAALLREVLNLSSGVWKGLPDDLVLAPFVASRAVAPPDLLLRLEREHRILDSQIVEFLGDAVLQLLATEVVLRLLPSLERPGRASLLRQQLVRNASLECYMRAKKVLGRTLCEQIYAPKLDRKTCADAFEAVVGVLYAWLRDVKKLPNALPVLADWFSATWDLDVIAAGLDETGVMGCSPASGSRRVSEAIASECPVAQVLSVPRASAAEKRKTLLTASSPAFVPRRSPRRTSSPEKLATLLPVEPRPTRNAKLRPDTRRGPLSSLPTRKLRTYATDRDVAGAGSMTKEELVEALLLLPQVEVRGNQRQG